MELSNFFYTAEDEKPLERAVSNGGYCGIFRKLACVGDSLSSGEHESNLAGKVGCHDYYDYSWGQYIARDAGCTVYNFSKGGMSAKEYCEKFADEGGFWNIDYRAQGYIIALGVNDIYHILQKNLELGSVEDIDKDNYRNNKPTFAGYYAQIIQRYKEIQPKAKFFLMTIPKRGDEEKQVDWICEYEEWADKHAELLYAMSELFENCYLLDFRKYAVQYNKEFKKQFFLGGHMSAAGYRLTALMTEAYIDYIIRHNSEDFKQVGFIGTPYYNETEKW